MTISTATEDVLVGINYFAGWWEELPNKWSPYGTDWRCDYPDRIPLLGQYNVQDTFDREVQLAAMYGVDYFLTLYYYEPPDKPSAEPHSRLLNRPLDQFVRSRHAHLMKFAIEYCNHDPFGAVTEAQWQECIATWMPAFRHPSYLRVGGRLVFKIHSFHHFYQQWGEDLDVCRQRLAQLRAAVRTQGLGELVLACGVSTGDAVPAHSPLVELFDFGACYMGVPPLTPSAEDYPYTELATFANEGRIAHSQGALPYMPYVPAGWNPRPWADPRPSFRFPTRAEWTAEMAQVVRDLHTLPMLGIPHPDGRLQPAFHIYAWNEFGEGGIVAPTQGDQYMKLEVIRSLFAPHLAPD